jgi:hypothetical protein
MTLRASKTPDSNVREVTMAQNKTKDKRSERTQLSWENIPWDQNRTELLEFYKSFGEWARHYSTVRMTVGTFFVTLSFTILHLRWDKPDLFMAASALAAFVVGLSVFVYFSNATFKRMNDQIRIFDSFLRQYTTDKIARVERTQKPFRTWTQLSGAPLAALFFLIFLVVDLVWVWPVLKGKPPPQQVTEIRLPIILQLGTSRVSLEVPITVMLDAPKTPAK